MARNADLKLADDADAVAAKHEAWAVEDAASGHTHRAAFHTRQAAQYRDLATVYRAHAGAQ